MGDTALKRFQLGLEGGYTSGSGSVYNGGSSVVATRRLAVEKAVGADFKPTFESPVEARGTYAGSYTHILHMMNTDGKLPAYVYADDMTYFGRMLFSGVPTVTTLPNTPQVLLAATSLSSSMTLTSQPNAQADTALGKLLALTLYNASGSSTSVTFTVTGTGTNAAALTETVAFSSGTTTTSKVTGTNSVTLYTRNYFATVTSIATSAQPAGDTLAVAGVNAFFWVFTPDMSLQQSGSTLYSATGEYFDGTGAWQLPGMVLEKGTFTAEMGKSFKFDASYQAQKKIPLVSSANSINPSASAGTFQCFQNLSDNVISAIPTYTTRYYADPIGSVPGTTQINARLTTYKFDVDNDVKLGKAADGTPYANFVGRSYYGPKVSNDVTLLFNSSSANVYDPVDVGYFLSDTPRTILAAFPGQALPTGTLSVAGNWPAQLQDANNYGGYYGMTFAMSGTITDLKEKDVDGRAAFDFKVLSQVDQVAITAPYQVQIVSRINPNL